MDSLDQELTAEMIPDGIRRQIALEIGVDNLLKLARLVGGQRVYIAKAEELLKPVRDRHIRQEFSGYNYAELSTKYGMSETHIRRICGKRKVRMLPIADQLRLF